MENSKVTNLFNKIGMPRNLAWGYLGVLIFMMGDGMEQGWLSPYLIDRGILMEASALLFTVYGITIGIASWFSGVLADILGVRKTMFYGFVIYLIGVVGFVGLALTQFSYPLMLITYAIKGFGYPLFAYTFLVWIAYESPKPMLGKAVGWFWFVFTGGLSVLGAFYSSWAVGVFGHMTTLWTAVLWAFVGAFFCLYLMRFNRKETPVKASSGRKSSKMQELLKGFTIMKEEPKILIAGLVRIVNTMPQFGFPVFLPLYMLEQGFETAQWLQIWGVALTGNIIFNLIFGFVGDYVGWRKTVMWFGCVGCAVTSLLFYYMPQIVPGNIYLTMAAGFSWGALMAGFVPLSALVPSLVKGEKGAAMSVLNLGAGLSAFAGPALVGIFFPIVGSEGMIFIISGLYLVCAVMMKFVTLPEEKLGTPAQLRAMNMNAESA